MRRSYTRMDMQALGRFHRWRAISSSMCERCCEPTTCARSRMHQGLLTRRSIRLTSRFPQTKETRAATKRQKLRPWHRRRRSPDDTHGSSGVDHDRRSSAARRILREFSRDWAAGAGARDRDSRSEDAEGRVRAVRPSGQKRIVSDLPDARRARVLLAKAWASRGIYSVRFRQSEEYRIPDRP